MPRHRWRAVDLGIWLGGFAPGPDSSAVLPTHLIVRPVDRHQRLATEACLRLWQDDVLSARGLVDAVTECASDALADHDGEARRGFAHDGTDVQIPARLDRETLLCRTWLCSAGSVEGDDARVDEPDAAFAEFLE